MSGRSFTGIFELELRREIVFEHLQLCRKWAADLRSFSDEPDADVIEAVRRERTLEAYLEWIEAQIRACVEGPVAVVVDSLAVEGAGEDHRDADNDRRDAGRDGRRVGDRRRCSGAAGEGDG